MHTFLHGFAPWTLRNRHAMVTPLPVPVLAPPRCCATVHVLVTWSTVRVFGRSAHIPAVRLTPAALRLELDPAGTISKLQRHTCEAAPKTPEWYTDKHRVGVSAQQW